MPLEVAPFPTRRAVYGFIDRYNLDPTYRTFDFPTPTPPARSRSTTIVPQQALFLLNSPFVAEQARHLAARPEVVSGSTEERIRASTTSSSAATPSRARSRWAGSSSRSRRRRSGDDFSFALALRHRRRSTASSRGRLPAPCPTGRARPGRSARSCPTRRAASPTSRRHGGHPGPDAASGRCPPLGRPGRRRRRDRRARSTTPRSRATASAPGRSPAGRGRSARGRRTTARSRWPSTAVEVKRGETIDFVVDCRASDGVRLVRVVADDPRRRPRARRPPQDGLGRPRRLPRPRGAAALALGELRPGAPADQRIPLRRLTERRSDQSRDDHDPRHDPTSSSRREMLRRSGMGFGTLALGGLLADAGMLAARPRSRRRRSRRRRRTSPRRRSGSSTCS